MRWLLHGPETCALADALRRHGHSVEQLEQMPQSHEDLLKTAHQEQLDVLTSDASFVAHSASRPVKFDRSIVLLQLGGSDAERDDAVHRLFERYKRLSPGRIYTITASRVKVRQLPGSLRRTPGH